MSSLTKTTVPPAGPEQPRETDGSNTSSAIGRAFSLINILVEAGRPLSLAELAEAAGLPKPSAHRMLVQLEGLDLLRRDISGKRYLTGPMLTRLAIGTLRARMAEPEVREIMLRLVDDLGETCNLGILDGHEVLYVERVESNFPLRLELRTGSRVPVHCTAMGKLFLAHLPPRKRQALLAALPLDRYTDKTFVTPEDLIAEVSRAQARDIAINDEEFVPGLIGLAVPVRNDEGRAVAGLAIHAPRFRLSMEEAMAKAKTLQAAADELSHLLYSD